MIDLLKGAKDAVEGAGNAIDKNTTTQQEIDQELTTRHKNDMQSDNWLSKSIRPLTLLIFVSLQIFIIVASSYNIKFEPTIIAQHGLMTMTALGFYFRSRQIEKIAKENVKGNIELEKQREKTERQKARQAARLERIEARRNK